MSTTNIGPGDWNKNTVVGKVKSEQWDKLSFNLNGHNYMLADYSPPLRYISGPIYVFDVEVKGPGVTYDMCEAKLDEDIYTAIRMWLRNDVDMPIWQFLHGIFDAN